MDVTKCCFCFQIVMALLRSVSHVALCPLLRGSSSQGRSSIVSLAQGMEAQPRAIVKSDSARLQLGIVPAKMSWTETRTVCAED